MLELVFFIFVELFHRHVPCTALRELESAMALETETETAAGNTTITMKRHRQRGKRGGGGAAVDATAVQDAGNSGSDSGSVGSGVDVGR